MFPGRMPVRIDQRADGGVGLRVQFLDFVFQNHHGAAKVGETLIVNVLNASHSPPRLTAIVRLTSVPALSSISFLQYDIGNENRPLCPVICLAPDFPSTIKVTGSSPR